MSLDAVIKKADSTRAQIHAEWLKAVQSIADEYQVEIATGHLSNTWQCSEPGKEEWLAEYDKEKGSANVAAALEALQELDDKTEPYGVGPSNMERFKPNPPVNQYEKQAAAFLEKFGIKFRATLSDSKPPPWQDPKIAAEHRHHYRVTLSRPATGLRQPNGATRITFDFWASIADAEKGITTVTPYDVLACISNDTHCAESFEEWCGDMGESTDSIRARQTYNRCAAFAKRLQSFFTAEEIEALREIQ